MSVETFTPTEQGEFRGLHTTEQDQTSVPKGFSPSCTDVVFRPGGRVSTRPGITLKATIASTSVRSLFEYVSYQGLASNTYRNLMAAFSDGSLRAETGNYSFAALITDIVEAALGNTWHMKATNLFGRCYMAFPGGNYNGIAHPRIYEQVNANTDPHGTENPGIAPTVAASASGSSVTVGTHKFRVFYKTRNGYWTGLGPAFSLNVTVAGKGVDVTGIPTGPPWITARVIAATPAFSNTFYFIEGSSMVINDNTTTSVTGMDFTDTALTAATQVTNPLDPSQDLFRQQPSQQYAGFTHYNNRLVAWGARSAFMQTGDAGFYGMKFQSGWTGSVPNGWTQKVAGQSKTAYNPANGNQGEPLTITGDGTNQKACMENQGQANLIIPQGVPINVRVKLKKNATLTAGTLHFYFSKTTDPVTVPATNAQINVATSVSVGGATGVSSTEWRVFQVQILSQTQAQALTMDSTYRLRFSTGGTGAGLGTAFTNLGTCSIDYIEIYSPSYGGEVTQSKLFISKANNPEAVDQLQGIISTEPDNGEMVTGAFPMRGLLYVLKERSMFAVTDNATGEPFTWNVDQISRKIGTPSKNGYDLGDGWAIIASRSGLYHFNGSALTRISDEIDLTWKRINWAAHDQVFVLVDSDQKRVYVGLALDGSTVTNYLLTLDYMRSDSPLEIYPSIGGTTGYPQVRNYTLWTPPNVLCAALSIRAQNNNNPVIVLGDNSGRIGEIDVTATNDWGSVRIASLYRTYFYDTQPGRELLGDLVVDINGSGNMAPKIIQPDGVTSTTLLTKALTAGAAYDYEWYCNARGERLAVEFASQNLNDNFQLSRMLIFTKVKPAGVVRHHTP